MILLPGAECTGSAPSNVVCVLATLAVAAPECGTVAPIFSGGAIGILFMALTQCEEITLDEAATLLWPGLALLPVQRFRVDTVQRCRGAG
jgi:hypothetical protein